MKLVSLKEFRSISLISSDALIWLIENNSLPFSFDQQRGLLIDIDSVNVSDLVKAIGAERTAISNSDATLLSEQAGRIIRENFDSIISAAIAEIKAQQE